jgi:hypothetical protein
MILTIEVAVGYMLKALKNQQRITESKNEFNAIKHGDNKTLYENHCCLNRDR